MALKVCCTCRQEKPTTEYYRDRRTADGFYLRCKACHRASTEKWRQAHPEKVNATAAAWRRRNPERAKAVSNKSAAQRYQNLGIREERKARTRRWYAANKERASAYHKRYRAKNAEQKKRYFADYYLAHAARLKDRAKALGALWVKRHPEKGRARTAKHIAAKKRATPAWADEREIAAIYSRCIDIERHTGIAHHVDHMVPLQGKTVRGLHVHYNLQILPGKENQSKGARFWPDMP